ncbi:MAG: pilus assembly PilX N-terminal domain-containing protein [Candidatus Acidiferrales bacterium]
MKPHHNPEHRSERRAGGGDASRGVALVTTLLILMLLVAMTLAMTISVTSDTLINKYYRNARASFYAADSGVNVARQYMISQIENSISYSTDYTSATAPISSGEMTTALNNAISAYGSKTSILGGSGASSWPSSFTIEKTYSGTVGTTLPTTTPTPTCSVAYTGTAKNSGPFTCTNLPTGVTITGYTYSYTIPYTITAVGQSLASEQQVVEDEGNVTLNVTEGQTSSTTFSFAGWGMFIDQFPICTDGDLVGGTITGPVFTNGAWTFGESSYTFTGSVGSVSSKFGYDFGTCYQSSATSYKSGSTTIAPTFQAGTNLGASAVSLPTNSFNQKEAVADGLGNSWTGDSTAQQDTAMNAALKDVNNSGSAYPAAGTTANGVYLAYSSTTVGSVTTNTMTGGGIYVEGNATDVELQATTAGNGDPEQVYVITQGSTVTTIVEDLTANTTTVGSKTGSTTKTTTIVGIPEIDTGTSPSPATMLYVDGTIGTSGSTGLSGPGQGVPAIQNGAAVTVTAASSINITGDLLYNTEPVTTSANQSVSSSLTTSSCCSGDPTDTLIPYKTEPTSVLGIFTANGNVNLDNQQSNGNLEIDASIATISAGGSGGIVNNGNAIDTLTIVGGRIQNTIQDINTSTRNVDFDQRFSGGTFAPPWFPSTTLGATNTLSVNSVTPTFQRTFWLSMN